MGNRANRIKANALLKEWGIPYKFCKGKSKEYTRRIKNCLAQDIIFALSAKPGELVGECDATNHIVEGFRKPDGTNEKGFSPYVFPKDAHLLWANKFGVYLICLPILFYTNNRMACCPREKWTRKASREEYLCQLASLLVADFIYSQSERYSDRSKEEAIFEFLMASPDNHVCDEQGILYDKYK